LVTSKVQHVVVYMY